MDAVVVRGVTKTYRMGVGRARVREMLPWPLDAAVRKGFPRWWMRDAFNALEEVSVSVPAGSSLGIVGHNGAGKTTLLKIIAGVTQPNLGVVSVSGRVGALLDLLTGYHPELTGRENVYLLGAVYGFDRRAMRARVDGIFEFAEIDELADTPLKRYSAGMAARLAFATITALDLSMLLVDEVLAVGDAAYQRKCVGWLDDYRARGGTLLFVSHNLGLVRNMTERCVWLDHGRVAAEGETADILAQYAKAMERRDEWPSAGRRRGRKKEVVARGLYRWGAGGVRVEEVRLEDAGEGTRLEVAVTYDAALSEATTFCIGFLDEGGREIGAAASPPVRLMPGRGVVRCVIDPLPFRSGIYFPVVAVVSPEGLVRDRWRLDRAIVVEHRSDGALDGLGPVEINGTWTSQGS